MAALSESRDIRALLGMDTKVVRIAVVPLYLLAFGSLAMGTRGMVTERWGTWCVLVLSVAGIAVLIYVPADPLPVWASAFILVTGIFASWAALACIEYPAPYVVCLWHEMALAVVYVFTCIRGRNLVAWAGALGGVAVTVDWAVRGGGSVAHGLAQGFVGVGPVLIGSIVAWLIRPSVSAVFDLRRQVGERRAREAAAQAVAVERDARLKRLDETARPLLTRIAAGGPLGPADRRAARLLEARLRDEIRAPSLLDDDVAAAVAGAWARGVEVVLLDDGGGGELPSGAARRFRTVLAGHLMATSTGRVTARRLPPGRDVALTVVVASGEGDPERHEYRL